MIDLWRYENCRKVNVIDTSGAVFSGGVLEWEDADEEEGWEETITVEAKDGTIRMFAASEIESIELIKK